MGMEEISNHFDRDSLEHSKNQLWIYLIHVWGLTFELQLLHKALYQTKLTTFFSCSRNGRGEPKKYLSKLLYSLKLKIPSQRKL